MSLDLEARLRVFFASAPQALHPVQTLEISHSAMATWHLWREPYAGTTTVDGIVKPMTPANISIKLAGSPGHLDQVFQFQLGLVDSMDLFRAQMDLVPIGTLEKVIVIYREFLSDQLDAPQAQARLQIESISYVKGAANFSAVSPRLNALRTGESYNPREIPMLRAFI
jgi:hypothetical protein